MFIILFCHGIIVFYHYVILGDDCIIKNIFLSNLNLKDINPTECGEEYCDKNFRAGPTARQYYLLHYVFSGSGFFHTANNQYTVSKGQIFIIHPYEIVHYNAEPSDPWHYCWVGFEMSFESPILTKSSVIFLPQAEHIFCALKDSDKLDANKELYICGKIYELLSTIGDLATKAKNKSDEYVNKAKQYMDINYIHPITIDQIAKDLNISRSYFSTIFRKCLGKSPQQYLLDKRLENAAGLIINYGYSVTDAAMSSGYPDIFNFSKMFKRKFGFSPSYYAKSKNSKNSKDSKDSK